MVEDVPLMHVHGDQRLVLGALDASQVGGSPVNQQVQQLQKPVATQTSPTPCSRQGESVSRYEHNSEHTWSRSPTAHASVQYAAAIQPSLPVVGVGHDFPIEPRLTESQLGITSPDHLDSQDAHLKHGICVTDRPAGGSPSYIQQLHHTTSH